MEHLAGKKKDDFVIDYVEKHPNESGIIYCSTRKNVNDLQMKLFKRGVPVTGYHAGLDNSIRKKSQDDFIYDRAPVVVATNAFGMGIDKSNVRYVIHYNMPQSMENYYQEAGRAGRDGENSQCILLFSAQDVIIARFLLEQKEFEDVDAGDIELIKQRDTHRLLVMEGYCKTTSCLRNYILEYFGERRSLPCDNCGNCHGSFTEADMTFEAKWVINCIAETKGRFGKNIVSGTLVGANRARLREVGATGYRSYGVLKEVNEKDVQVLIDQMVMEGYIVQAGEYRVLQMGDISGLRDENIRVTVRKPKEKEIAAFRRQNLGFVFQDFNLLDTFSLKDNIFLPLVLSGKKYEEMEARIIPVTQMLGIEDLLEKFPYEVSGGQKQRAAVARALITRPQLVLADEPTGALDSRAADGLLDLFKTINENGQTILMVTHSVKAASTANRVLFIKDGEVFHQLYRGNLTNEQMYQKISDTLTVLTTGGERSE